MDAVNKVVTAASTALWGENGSQSQQAVQQHGDEPLSGVQGKGAASDPYDAGNRDEQPDAPSTDVNTASQHPTIDGQSKNASKTTHDSATSTNATPTTTAEESKPKQAAEVFSSSASAAESSNSSTEKKGSESAEQRSTSQSEGESSSGERSERSTQEVAAAHDVSEEALKGPQGPAPHSAEEFEKESKGRKSAPKEVSAKSNESNSSPSKSSEKSEHGSGNGSASGSGSGGSEKSHGTGSSKESTMSKVREQLHKVAHPQHGNKA